MDRDKEGGTSGLMDKAARKRLDDLSLEVGQALKSQRWKLSTAESCTGGWIAQCVTDVAGSSDWFDMGIVSYSNASKQNLLGVPRDYLEGEDAPGAVSEETVLAMARGALNRSEAGIAVATSGIAGPGGGSEVKPVGTVWIGWAWGRDTAAQRYMFAGDRYAVRLQSVLAALEGVHSRCKGI